jgi:hypothetical protein
MYYNGFFYSFPCRSLHSGAQSIHVSHFCVGWERGVFLGLYFLLLFVCVHRKVSCISGLIDYDACFSVSRHVSLILRGLTIENYLRIQLVLVLPVKIMSICIGY